jgi:hypothetical protein
MAQKPRQQRKAPIRQTQLVGANGASISFACVFPYEVTIVTERELPDLIDTAHDPDTDRPSITEINGSIARFGMAYEPDQSGPLRFGPPRKQLLFSYAFAVLSLALLAVTVFGYMGPSQGLLFRWMVEGDRGRALPAWILALVITASGIGTALRARMLGVLITGNGIEARSLLALGIPKVERWGWAQIDRFLVDEGGVVLELWNGTHTRLPEVADPTKFADCIEQVALARKREVTRLKPLP